MCTSEIFGLFSNLEIEIWFCKQNCKMAYVLALPEAMCEILMKFMIHILKALDISYWKMQEKFEIITNHKLQFWTTVEILQNFVAFSEYMNFTLDFCIW